ncbi:MAG: hypothetical protein ACXVQ5_12725 [Actinomycetota bacterium]
MRRGGIVIGLATAIIGVASATASAASIYEAVPDCINPPPANWITAPSHSGDPFVVHAPPGASALAADAAHEIRTKDFFGFYEARLDIGALGYPNQTGKFDVYLDPELPSALPQAAGVNATMCTDTSRDAIDVWSKITTADEFHATLAHELFHAAQARLAGGNFANNWFYEATATWAETRFGYSDPKGFSTLVTEKPQLPMDQFKKASDGSEAHEYGAWTFVAWLFSRDKIDWTTMKNIFIASAHTATTPILMTKLADAGTTLGDEVASFWADHTNPKPQFGPKTKVKPDVISAEEDELKIKLAPYLAAHVGAFKLAANRHQMVVIIHKLPAGVQVWLNLGKDHFLVLREGDSLNDTFCRGLTTGGSYELPDNGALPFAITSTSDKAPATLKVKVLTSSKPCPKPLLIQPGLAVGPLHLGMSLHAADQALPKRTPLNGPVPTPYGAYTVADYREAKGAGAIAGFLDGRIAFLLIESPKFETTTGIHTLTMLPPIPGAQAFIPASLVGDLGAKHCASLGNDKPPSLYCWKEGPKTRYTVVLGSDADPCPAFADEPPPCTYPKADYAWGIAVTTSRGLKLLRFGADLFAVPPV